MVGFLMWNSGFHLRKLLEAIGEHHDFLGVSRCSVGIKRSTFQARVQQFVQSQLDKL